ncbi:MAG: hypothetical protein ACFFE2_13435 [Candidatus Thorarchaeota archaeon]
MAYTANQQTALLMEPTDTTEHKEVRKSVKAGVYDEDSRRYRSYLAQQQALRLMEQRKAKALATAHVMSLIR